MKSSIEMYLLGLVDRPYEEYILCDPCKAGDMIKTGDYYIEVKRVVDMVEAKYSLNKRDIYYVQAYEITKEDYRNKMIDLLVN